MTHLTPWFPFDNPDFWFSPHGMGCAGLILMTLLVIRIINTRRP